MRLSNLIKLHARISHDENINSILTNGQNIYSQYLINSFQSSLYLLYKELSEFELCLELLTQVKNGNCLDSDLRECTRLSQTVFDQIMEPLLMGRLVTKNLGDAQGHVSFSVTD